MTPKAAILRRLDQLREGVESGDVGCVMLVAVGDALTVSVVGTLPPLPVAHAAALALLAQVHDVIETHDDDDVVDETVTGNDDEDDDGGEVN